ncbi:hypothetical protein HY68_05655 [Streptomyces sp. AcH 505]|uniref:hypothetical protein n=1 Tax=Streptomyces sp. AcH 505 TaxID=352211 RepID=UPI000591E8E1|nr:hypothetical protein HY68_05655 [Streptomyces sp. AcH 505]
MYANQAVTHLVPLAADLDENKVTPGVLGFVVFAVMAVGVWMLMKSMNRHMGKVDFKEAPARGGSSARGESSGSASAIPAQQEPVRTPHGE